MTIGLANVRGHTLPIAELINDTGLQNIKLTVFKLEKVFDRKSIIKNELEINLLVENILGVL